MSTRLTFGPFVLDAERGTLAREGRPVALSSRGFQLLKALAGSARQVGYQGRPDASRVVRRGDRGEQSFGSDRSPAKAARTRTGWWRVDRNGPARRLPVCRRRSRRNSQVADRSRSITPEDRPSIAVLPFINLGGDKEQEYLADGITEDIITALTRFRWFFVIARNSSFFYKGKSLDVKQIAQDLGVRYLLEGSVRKSGTTHPDLRTADRCSIRQPSLGREVRPRNDGSVRNPG